MANHFLNEGPKRIALFARSGDTGVYQNVSAGVRRNMAQHLASAIDDYRCGVTLHATLRSVGAAVRALLHAWAYPGANRPDQEREDAI